MAAGRMGLQEGVCSMITVHVRLYATLRRLRPDLEIGEALPVQLPEGASVGQLIQQLDLPADQIKIVFVNNLVRDWDHVLAEGDALGIFPPVGGG
jgi:molybdopterin converting factor small subunit